MLKKIIAKLFEKNKFIKIEKLKRFYNPPEYILCSAVHIDDLAERKNQPVKRGFIICGRRHSDCFVTLKILKGDIEISNNGNTVMGFLTSKNRFVSRQEALPIAVASNQIWHKTKIDSESKEFGLISEDLYYDER